MTAHAFARQLLAGPDLPIFVPKVVEYSDDDEDCVADPLVTEEEGYVVATGARTPILMIDRAFGQLERDGLIPTVHPSESSAKSAVKENLRPSAQSAADSHSPDTATHA
jgi:hypothetical protein